MPRTHQSTSKGNGSPSLGAPGRSALLTLSSLLLASACSPLAPSMLKGDQGSRPPGIFESHGLIKGSTSGDSETSPLIAPKATPSSSESDLNMAFEIKVRIQNAHELSALVEAQTDEADNGLSIELDLEQLNAFKRAQKQCVSIKVPTLDRDFPQRHPTELVITLNAPPTQVQEISLKSFKMLRTETTCKDPQRDTNTSAEQAFTTDPTQAAVMYEIETEVELTDEQIQQVKSVHLYLIHKAVQEGIASVTETSPTPGTKLTFETQE